MDYFNIVMLPAKNPYRLNSWIGFMNDKPMGVVSGGGSDYDWNENVLIIEVPKTIFDSFPEGDEKEQIKNNGYKIKLKDTKRTQYWGRDINNPISLTFDISKQDFMRIFEYTDYDRQVVE